MKLEFFPFTCGTWISNKGTMDNVSWGEYYQSPNPMFAFRHPKGVVLFDTGVNIKGVRDPLNWWGAFVSDITMNITPDDELPTQLARVGIGPEEVKYVVMSHLHIDHVGAMTSFPEATFIVRQSELRFAWWPQPSMRLVYPFNDLRDTRNFTYLELPDGKDFDIFGDGSLVCIHTPGHTPGHQSLLAAIPGYDKKILLCQDACYLRYNLGGNQYSSGLMWNVESWYHSLSLLQHYERLGCELWTGHDMDDWKRHIEAFR